MSMQDEVLVTLTALGLDDIDNAAAELARVYARQLDLAAIVRGQADKTVVAALKDGDDALIEQVQALRAKLGERECVDRIGRALTTLLIELQATPKSRAASPAGKVGERPGHGGRQASASAGALYLLRTAQAGAE